MKKFYVLCIVLTALFLLGCSDDERSTDFVNQVGEPSNLNVDVVMTQDNSGLVSFTLSGDNVSSFTIDYGDNSEIETIETLETVSHIYTEGDFTVTIVAANIAGETTTLMQDVMISFIAPQNLEVTVSLLAQNSFGVEVRATADFASNFDVFFGDVIDEVPENFLAGESITHIYAETGTYDIRVIARNGGSGTTEQIVPFTIEEVLNPVTLPIDFEDVSQEFVIVAFEGAESSIVDNPVSGGINTSTRVIESIKTEGAQFFGGTFLDIDSGIEFSDTNTSISIDTYSPKANIPVRLAIESQAVGGDSQIFVDVNTSVENSWETLTFDFAGLIDSNVTYDRIVIFFEFIVDLPGDGSIYYFDNIELDSQGGVDNGLEANPDATGENTSATVMRSTKLDGSQFFAGTFLNLDSEIDFSNSTSISLEVYSPKANIPIRLALENQVTGNQIVVDVNTTVENTWEILTFDFSGLIDGNVSYDRVVVFFEFIVDLPGDGTTYYFDNIEVAN